MFEVRTFDKSKNKIVQVKVLWYKEHAIAYANAMIQDYIRDPLLEVSVWDCKNEEEVTI